MGFENREMHGLQENRNFFLRNNSREVVFVAGNGWDQVLALEQAFEIEVIEQILGCALDDGGVGGDAIEFGNGAVDHGGDDVRVVAFFLKHIGDAEHEHVALKIELEGAKIEKFVSAAEQFKHERDVILGNLHRALTDDGERIDRRVGLGVKLNAGVMGIECRAQHIAAFEDFAVPAMGTESGFDGKNL